MYGKKSKGKLTAKQKTLPKGLQKKIVKSKSTVSKKSYQSMLRGFK